MLPIEVRCPDCKKSLRVSPSKPGRIRFKCPQCSATIEATAEAPSKEAFSETPKAPLPPVPSPSSPDPGKTRSGDAVNNTLPPASAPSMPTGTRKAIDTRWLVAGCATVLLLGVASVGCVGIGIWAFVASRNQEHSAKDKMAIASKKDRSTKNEDDENGAGGEDEWRGQNRLIPFNAIGNRKRLEEVKTVQIKGKTRFMVAKNVNEVVVTWESLKRMRYDEKIGFGPGYFTVLLIGEHGWVKTANQNLKLKGDGLGFYQNFNYATILSNLIPLMEKGFEIEKGDDTLIREKKCYEVIVKRAGRPNMKMFFEKETSLLFKADFSGRFVNQQLNFEPNSTFVEFYFSDYQVTDGIKHWRKQEQWRDGKRYSETTLSEVVFLKKSDDALFIVNGLEGEIRKILADEKAVKAISNK